MEEYRGKVAQSFYALSQSAPFSPNLPVFTKPEDPWTLSFGVYGGFIT